MSYNTKQKNIILGVIRKQDHEFTVKDIYNEVKDELGLTTVYRMIDRLVLDKYLSKSISKDNVTYYQYLEKCDNENHFYLKCNICGAMEHVDCDCIDDLYKHILKTHKFKLSKDNIIINGLCNKCSSK